MDMHDRLQEHDHRQRENRIERAVLQIPELRQCAALNQHDRHRADIHRADAEADGDQQDIGCQSKGPDHAIKGKARVKHLKIEKRAQPALCSNAGS